MKNIYVILFVWSLLNVSLYAQQIDQPSVGANYSQFTYYNISDGATTIYEHGDWDIALSIDGFEVGVFVNEGVGISFTSELPQVELYLAASTDFATADTVGMARLYNDEVSWSQGAFNLVANPDNPADYGWGSYDFMTHQVHGSRVYILKLRNGKYRKLQIQSLIGSVYTLVHTALDGSDEVIQTIDKADFENKTLAYVSLENETVLDLEPAAWDLLFTRYVTPLDAGGGLILDYVVTGVLSNAGIEVAEVRDINPDTVNPDNYENSYTDTIGTIGHDWKAFNNGWEVDFNRVYFVKTKQNELWKLVFYDFEGSSSGVTTLERTFVAEVTSTQDVQTATTFEVFPNPATDRVELVFETTTATDKEGRLLLSNSLGQTVFEHNIRIQNGLNAASINVEDLPAGSYIATLVINNTVRSKPIIKQ